MCVLIVSIMLFAGLITDSSNSLFTYFPYETFSLFKQDSFPPIFEVVQDESIAETCFTDPFCVYDTIVTGNMSFGLDTRTTMMEVVEVASLSNSGDLGVVSYW